MGASYEQMNMDGRLSTKEVESNFKEVIKDCCMNWGMAGYTGTFAEAQGIKFPRVPTFESQEDAYCYVEDVAEKWGPALAVNYTDANGQIKWYIGAWCSN